MVQTMAWPCRAPSPCMRVQAACITLASLVAQGSAQCNGFTGYRRCQNHGDNAQVLSPVPSTHGDCHSWCESLNADGCCFVRGDQNAPSDCHFQPGYGTASANNPSRYATTCTAVVDSDCLGTWSSCTASCEAAGDRQWTETSAQSGSGAACPPASDCEPGDGNCPVNTDCAGTWSSCTASCEAAGDRQWTETSAQSGSGAACPPA
eukprot:COSAG02_NODE_2024_length_10084_cov_130.539509_12_plen_205_part_01